MLKILHKNFYKARRGSSLLIALGLVTVIVLVSLGITTVVVSSVRESVNVNRANQAYYAAEGALEVGLLANQLAGAGFTGNIQPVSYAPPKCNANNPGPHCSDASPLHASYQIQGQVPEKFGVPDNLYGIPRPGTGNAGTNCDQANKFIEGQFVYSPSSIPHYIAGSIQPDNTYLEPKDAADHPCNWNKIGVAESVSIPLYSIGNNPACPVDPDDPTRTVCNPFDLGLTTLKIKVRTPCIDGNYEFCIPSARYQLENTSPNQNAEYGGDDPILSWQIDGGDMVKPVIHTFQPVNDYIGKEVDQLNPHWLPATSVVTEGKINTNINNTSFIVLVEGKGGIDENTKKGSILGFLKNSGIWNTRVIKKPVLKLTVIHSLEQKNTGEKIPYLEYQILTNTTIQPPDLSQSITSEGFSGSFKQVLQVKKPQESGLLEYVIQQ